jgi:uroporphyrin-III C-methyltransferase/precorrin-2 dehydrogenase/sirohydrochlorin ferrochelatase
MRHYPIFLDLRGRTVLVLGDGEIAARKSEPLAQAGATIRQHATFNEAALDGCALAIGADAAEADLQALSKAAQRRGIPVNIVDRPELCSFIMPATIDRDPITIAVSTAGAAPVLARLLRSKIEALIPPAFGRLAALAERCKAELRAHLPDLALRRRLLERAFAGPIAELVFAGQDEAAERAFRAAIAASGEERRTGMVFLVGAGPGAADLLTLRAQRLLGEADVIVHDRLVSDAVLEMARRDAERIFVGKARANHCLKQEDINALLVRLAQEGRKVVRLKGGDPFVFGRGGEEAEALDAAGIAFEIVPGITAALACAAQARIPLTHREVSRALTLVTGHTKEGDIDVDFAHIAQSGGTLAVYMGLVTLPKLRDGLFAHGLPAHTPAALIERGGTPQQRNLFGTLDQLVDRASAWSTQGPILALIGPAVARATTYAAGSQHVASPAETTH